MGDAIKEAIITPKTLRLILPHHMMGGNHSSMTPTQSIIMLSGIYYWAMYGGSTTSILLNVPGEGTSMITCLDGYPMAKAGRAGQALGISAFGSFIAGTFSVFMLMIPGPILASVAIKFGSTRVCSPHPFGAHPGHLSGKRIDDQGYHDGRLWTASRLCGP